MSDHKNNPPKFSIPSSLKPEEHRKHRNRAILVLVVWIMFLTRAIWNNNATIVFSDLDFGINDEDYLVRMTGVFNTKFSSMNFFNLSRLVFTAPHYLLSLIFGDYVPSFLLKSIIMSVLLFSGIGMYLLCSKILQRHFGVFVHRFQYYGLIIPALYYTINPWVMFRIQHIFLLPGYACFPWMLSYFFDMFREKLDEKEDKSIVSFKLPFLKRLIIKKYRWDEVITAIKMAVVICIGSAAIHYFFFIILTVVMLSVAILIHSIVVYKKTMYFLRQFVRRHFLIWLSTLVICAYWIIPYIVAMFTTNIEPNNVNVIDTLSMFSRNSSLRNILYLVSYWWPMFNTEIFLDNLFWIGGAIFLFLMVYIVLYRFNKHFYITLFSIMTIFSVGLATGVNNNWLDKFNIMVVTNIPVFGQIFRDPNKLVGLMVAYFAILISFAVDRYVFLLRRNGYGRIVMIIAFSLLIMAHYYYYRPFELIFSEFYYSGAKVPKEYYEVNKNHVPEEGKVLWLPTMENMLLSNGVSNYQWNVSENGNDANLSLIRSVGDFHQYSSSKDIIFQNENNDGAVTYLNSFIQTSLDTTGGQNLDEFIKYAGFNEVAFHKDIMGQEERQAFNYMVLKNQEGLKPYYQDKIFTLFGMPKAQKEIFSVNRIAYNSKDLNSFMYMLDYSNDLKISPNTTGMFWSQQKKQQVHLSETDLMVGDSQLDFVLSALDNKYFIYPFNKVNTADPNTGWAKTLLHTSEWEWILRTNGIPNHFEYDYSRGIAFTNVSKKLTIPNYKIPTYKKQQLLYTSDILNGFFTPDDPTNFKLTVFPETGNATGILQGAISKAVSRSNVWQVAKSKTINVSDIKGGFLRIETVVSGIGAGSIHFKIRYYDENGKEVGIGYVSKADNASEFSKSEMYCDSHVPEKAVTMNISILNMQDTVRETYFWIHDFRMYSVSDYAPNVLEVPIEEKSATGDYHVFIRAFESEQGSKMTVSGDSNSKVLDFNGTGNSFKWVDAGEFKLANGLLKILPNDGFTAINAIAVIPKEKVEVLFHELLQAFVGYQTDFGLADQDYQLNTDMPIKDIESLILFPNTITGSQVIMNNGTLTKEIDILRGGTYQFAVTGNIAEHDDLQLILSKGGEDKVLNVISEEAISRNFQNQFYKIANEKNKYYLRLTDAHTTGWEVQKYEFEEAYLEPGTYTVQYRVKTNEPNLVNHNSLHELDENEVIIPQTELDDWTEIYSILASNFSIAKTEVDGKTAFINTKTKSKMWIIYANNQIKVDKNDLLVFKAKTNASGLKEVHAKLLWMDNGRVIHSSQYIPMVDDNEHYIICQSPVDGYVQPCFLSRSDTVNDGLFYVDSSELYIVDNFSKIEGTAMIPKMDKLPEEAGQVVGGPTGKVKVDGSRYLIQNEAYNPIWTFVGSENPTPITMNFIHNGFYVGGKEQSGTIMIKPLLNYTYLFSLILSILSVSAGIFLMLIRKKIKKIVVQTPADPK